MKKRVTFICLSWIISFLSLVPLLATTKGSHTSIINLRVDARHEPSAIDLDDNLIDSI